MRRLLMTYVLYFSSLLIPSGAFSQNSTGNKGTMNVVKPLRLLKFTRGNPNEPNRVDTFRGQESFPRPRCLTITSPVEGSRIVSFQMILTVNGVSKTFVSNSGCFSQEMNFAMNEINNDASMEFENIRAYFPDGHYEKLRGETIIMPRK